MSSTLTAAVLVACVAGAAAAGVGVLTIRRRKNPPAPPSPEDLWSVQGDLVDAKPFDGLPVEEVLYEMTSPLAYTTSRDEDTFLMYWSDVSRATGIERWLCVPTDAARVMALLENKLALRDALTAPRLWVLERTSAGSYIRAWQVESLDVVPEDAKPREGVFLRQAREESSQFAELLEFVDTDNR